VSKFLNPCFPRAAIFKLYYRNKNLSNRRIDSAYNVLKTIEILTLLPKVFSGSEYAYALSSFASVAIDTKFYIIGGLNSQSEPINSVYMYDVNLQT